MNDSAKPTASPAVPARNRFDRMEWAGAFGDLGTLIPFVVAYIGVLGVDPHGILFAFGVAAIVCGMAGHVRFGAQTGGASIILGTVLVLLASFFADSMHLLLKIFPTALLGVILFLTGAQLALGACEFSRDKGERFATVVTAGCALWNVGLAFVVGMAVLALARRGRLKL